MQTEHRSNKKSVDGINKNHSVSPKPEIQNRAKVSRYPSELDQMELRYKMAAPHNVKHIMYTQERPRKNSKSKALKSPIV